jgi:hypothetical protein
MKYFILHRYYSVMIAWHRLRIEVYKDRENINCIMFHARKEIEYTRKRYRLIK